jgi:hypothetical protein
VVAPVDVPEEVVRFLHHLNQRRVVGCAKVAHAEGVDGVGAGEVGREVAEVPSMIGCTGVQEESRLAWDFDESCHQKTSRETKIVFLVKKNAKYNFSWE